MWVATLGSFRRAAEKLHTTQPAVSQRIAALEAELGVRLLERTKRAVALTERGRALLAGAEGLLRSASALRASVVAEDAVRGTLRLGVSETIVHTWLPAFVERVSGRYPKLSIEIEVDITPDLTERLRRHDIDLAFLLGPVPGAAMRNIPLCRFPLGFLASPSLGLPSGSAPLTRLAQHPLVTFSRRTHPYRVLAALFGALPNPPRIHASASLATALRMAVDGIGIAVIPPAIATAEIASGRLAVIPCEAALPDLAFTASWAATADEHMAEAVAGIAGEVAGTIAGPGRRP